MFVKVWLYMRKYVPGLGHSTTIATYQFVLLVTSTPPGMLILNLTKPVSLATAETL